METVLLAKLVIFRSKTGNGGWKPVRPKQVPAWIRDDKDVVGNLIAGQMAKNGKSQWYRAVKVEAEQQPVAINLPAPRIVLPPNTVTH